MARTQQAIFSFSAGVLTPRITSRADTEQFAHALQECENFIVTPQGGAVFRQGFEYLNQAVQGRIFQFHQGGNESDILIEVYGDTINFYDDVGTVYNSITVPFGFRYDYPEDLYFCNQERYAIIVSPEHPPLYLELIDGQFVAEYLSAVNVPEHDFKDKGSPGESTELSGEYAVEFVEVNAGDWKSQEWFLTYNGLRMSKPAAREYSTNLTGMQEKIMDGLRSIPELNQSFDTQYSVTPVDDKNYTVIITGPNAGGTLLFSRTRDDDLRSIEVTPAASTTVRVFEKAWSYPTYVFHGSNYYQCIKPHVAEAGVNEPPNAEFWLDLGTTKPATFDWQYLDNTTDPLEGTNPWTDGEIYYPGGRGFPQVCCFHEQRLILAAPPAATTTFWGSALGDYKNFKTGVNADEAFSFTLDTSDTPSIKWMTSQIRLMMGSSSGDWRVDAQVTLGPTDVQVYKQNNARSYKTAPVVQNVNVFYVEQGNRKMRATRYSDDLNSFSSLDATISAEHLFHQGIKRLVILQTPEVMIVALRYDGTLVAMTFNEQMSAWYEFTSQGFIHDIAAYYSTVTNEDELWMQIAYRYDPAGPNQWTLEKMPYPSRTMTPYSKPEFGLPVETLSEQGVVHMDSWITGQMTVPNTITGLEHLEGKTVGVLVNDAWTGTYTVTNGTVILEDKNISGSEPYMGYFAAGLLYEGNLKTFEVAEGSYRQTSLGTVRRWSKLYARLLDSSLPIINGTLPPDRTPEMQMDIPEILRMGLQDVILRGGEWGDGSITVKQDRPYPTHLIGLFGQFQVGND